MNYLTLVSTHLKCVLNFIRQYPFYKPHDSQPPVVEEELSTRHYESTHGSEEHADCAVCLCKIGGGEEIRVLKCDHVFHRDCLDRWVGFKNATCPLCRQSVGPIRAPSEHGAEVLSFQFCFIRSDDHETWWLR